MATFVWKLVTRLLILYFYIIFRLCGLRGKDYDRGASVEEEEAVLEFVDSLDRPAFTLLEMCSLLAAGRLQYT